jgi:hypothetical protein
MYQAEVWPSVRRRTAFGTLAHAARLVSSLSTIAMWYLPHTYILKKHFVSF